MTTADPGSGAPSSSSASTPGQTPPTASGSPPPSLSAAASGLSQTSTIRLAPGAIPSAWTKPAEAVTRLPPPRPRPILSGAIVGVGVIACVALAFAIGPPASTKTAKRTIVAPPPAPPPPPPPGSFLADGAKPIGDVPAPAPPKPAVAPEDEAGDDVKPNIAEPAVPPGTALHPTPAKPATPTPATPTPTPATSTPATSSTATAAAASATSTNAASGDELPVRKKAKVLTLRAIGLLRDGNYADAEPVLVRAVLVDPSYPDGWRHLGIARAQLGDREGARRAYKKYLALAPNAPDAADVRKILGGK